MMDMDWTTRKIRFTASWERGSTINIVSGPMNFRPDHGANTRAPNMEKQNEGSLNIDALLCQSCWPHYFCLSFLLIKNKLFSKESIPTSIKTFDCNTFF